MVAALSSSEKETLPSCHVSYERFSISFQFPPSYIFSHCSPSEIYDQHYERSRSLVSNKTPSWLTQFDRQQKNTPTNFKSALDGEKYYLGLKLSEIDYENLLDASLVSRFNFLRFREI